jgi:hypothetical protein
MMDKDYKRELLSEFKLETLVKDKKVIDKYRNCYAENNEIDCDLLKDDIQVRVCETAEDKAKWKAFVHLTSSLPYRGAVGRQVKLFVMCSEHILGMVHLTSPLAQAKVRDAYLNFEDKWGQLKGVYNIETCVSVPKYSNLLTGKLLVYCVFSNEIKDYLKSKYGDDVIGFETTSLYGKSSIYNRIPFFKYLGLTEGLSAVYIKDDQWKKILNEYLKVYPDTKTKRLAPVKFQIVDKLSKYYAKAGKPFPYEYKSESFKRGVYFGYCVNRNIELSVSEWRDRWLIGRMGRVQKI